MDPNFLQNLRMTGIYGNGNTNSPTYNDPYMSLNGPPPYTPNQPNIPPPISSDDSNTDDISQLMNQLYQPEHTNLDRFNQLIGSFPQQKEPSTLRKIGAAALGTLADLPSKFGPHGVINPSAPSTGAGQFAFDEMTGKIPYQEAVQKWQNQIQPVEQAANIERENNSNARMMAYQTASSVLREKAESEKANNDAVKSQISQQRANVYQFMSENKDAKVVIPKGGNVMIEQNGQLTDTGVPSGSLSDIDRLNIEQHNKLIDIAATGAQTQQNITARGEQSRETKAVPSAPKPKTAMTPMGDREKSYNNAKRIHDTDPNLGKYIQLGPGANDFTIKQPGTNIFGSQTGPSSDEFKKLNDMIYGSGQTSTNTTNTTNTNQQPPLAPKGWKYIPKPGGGWTAVPSGGGGGQ